jgi:hypothetical protein
MEGYTVKSSSDIISATKSRKVERVKRERVEGKQQQRT